MSGVDLVQWLRDQLDEDERLARSMHPDPVASMALKYETAAVRMRSELKAGKSERVPYDEGQADALHWAAVVLPERMPALSPFGQDRVLLEIDAKRQLVAQIFRYEAKIDGEWGCSHSAEEIEAGECEETPPNEIGALRLLASPYEGRPGFKEEWRP